MQAQSKVVPTTTSSYGRSSYQTSTA